MTNSVDVVFDGPPDHHSPRFVEVENERGESIRFGEWVDRGDGTWALRLPMPTTAAPGDLAALAERLDEIGVRPGAGQSPALDATLDDARRILRAHRCAPGVEVATPAPGPCVYCGAHVSGGPGGWHDERGREVCPGQSPTTFHERTAPPAEDATPAPTIAAAEAASELIDGQPAVSADDPRVDVLAKSFLGLAQWDDPRNEDERNRERRYSRVVLARLDGALQNATPAPGYPFTPDYDACADESCGAVWSGPDPRPADCPECGGPALRPAAPAAAGGGTP